MLYMIVSTHTPEACPIANKTSMEKAVSANQRADKVLKALGITMQGMWTDMLAHTVFILVDVPKAELLSQMAIELQLMDWNTQIAHPVVTMQEALSRIPQQKK